MTHYVVEWHIDIEADTPEDAARQALAIHRDPTSLATFFDVYEQDDQHGRHDKPVAQVDALALPE